MEEFRHEELLKLIISKKKNVFLNEAQNIKKQRLKQERTGTGWRPVADDVQAT